MQIAGMQDSEAWIEIPLRVVAEMKPNNKT